MRDPRLSDVIKLAVLAVVLLILGKAGRLCADLQVSPPPPPPTAAGTDTLEKTLSFLAPILGMAVITIIAALLLRTAVREGIASGMEKLGMKIRDQLKDDISWQNVSDWLAREFLRPISASIVRTVNSYSGKSIVLKVPESRLHSIFRESDRPKHDELTRILKQVDEKLQENEEDEARKLLVQACSDYPDDFRPYGRHAQIDLEAGRPQIALGFLLPHRQRFQDHVLYLQMLGAAYRDLDQYDKALEVAREALILEPRNPALQNDIAYSLFRLGRLEEAIPKAEEALRLAQEDDAATQEDGAATLVKAEIQNALADYLSLRGHPEDRERALELSEQAIKRARIPVFLDTRGLVRIRLGATTDEVSSGIADIDAALREGLPREVGIRHLDEGYRRLAELSSTSR